MPTGTVFNIQHYSVHDGPGIRTIIFLKGCPLSCRWCSNPESHFPGPEVAFNPDKCIGGECKMCLKMAPTHVSWDADADRPILADHRDAAVVRAGSLCPAKAMSIYGQTMSVEDAVREVEKDESFYSRSGGGVTFSGGEPLMQADFLRAVIKECKHRSIHTAIETTAFAPWEEVREIFADLDYLMVDCKHIDPAKHKAWTGVDNSLVLENLKHIHAEFPDKPIRVRTPVIPGFNDDAVTLSAIAHFVKTELPNAEYELLKYHRFGLNKYSFIGKDYTLERDLELDADRFAAFEALVK
ncbi:MAG: glycyl-radical enzyme activating protein [Peptococcaceae bacterium]|nr:glycyl-radical enzyme activating protein [Peptococcaceae bacterium]